MKRKISKEAQKYISSEIRKLRHKGLAGKQAIAAAYSMARKRGYKVPKA